MKEIVKKGIGILWTMVIVCFTMLEPFTNLPLVVQAASKEQEKNYIYLTDLWNTDKLIEKESGWKDPRALKINQNEPGDLISLQVNGQQQYFLNGIFAHATSTLIFDISEYTKRGLDTFSAYIGVDMYAKSNGNGVQFTISGSTDNKNWTVLKHPSTTFKGNTDAEEVVIPVGEYNYLKLVASDLGGNSSDHSVYANAMLYDKDNFTPKVDAKVDWILTLEEYDDALKGHNEEEILNDEDLELKLLQRTLVKRVGYQIIQAYATDNDEEKSETLKWLFTHKDILKTYITGGEPLGNYINSFNVLSELYHKYKDDLNDPDEEKRETYLTMMMAISLTHSSTVAFWTSGEGNTQVVSNPLKRYESFKKLYLNQDLPETYNQTFDVETFEALTVEEMRWVVDARLSDNEIPWLNWFSSHLEGTKYAGSDGTTASMNPYTYIWYDASFKWGYTDEEYYVANSTHCGIDTKSPNVAGYSRGANCNDIYKLDKWGVGSLTNTQPRLWIVWEEDGVCGALSKTGENLHNSYGQVAAVTRQPAHAAYLIQTKKKDKDGKWVSTWRIGNDVSGWAKSSGTEKGERFPLNWGTTTLDYSSDYNGSYVILAQSAIDDFDNYVKALEYTLIADIYEEDLVKQENLYRAIVGTSPKENDSTVKNTGGIQNFNLDGWYGLIQTYLQNPNKNSDDYERLSNEIMANLKEYPLAMHDMLKLIESKLDDHDRFLVNSTFHKILTELSKVQNEDPAYPNGQAVRQVSQYLLGSQEENVKFSFSGENANKIVLATEQPFEYSLDYSYDASTKEVHGTWTSVTSGKVADLTDKLDQITSDKDIVVHIMGDDDKSPNSPSITIINIEEGTAPKNLYANDLENKVIGTTDSMEWKISSETATISNQEEWVKFKDQEPDLTGLKTVLVRDGAHDNYLPSSDVSFTFEVDPNDDPTKVYVPISRLSAKASSRQKDSEHERLAIDGNMYTYWHNLWDKSDTQKWIEIEVLGEDPIDLSKIEYVPRQDGTNGIFTKTKLEVSLDGNTWETVSDEIIWEGNLQTKMYILPTPKLAKYVRLTALESMGGNYFASAAMINLFENTTSRTRVDDLDVSYITSGYTYDGNPKEPSVTVKHKDKTLIKDEDYIVEYIDNVNAGTAQISIKGISAYTGRKNFSFEIEKAEHPATMPEENITVPKDTEFLLLAPLDTLPDGWYWHPDFSETKLVPGKRVPVKVVYYQEDADNYKTTEVTVYVTRENGNHPQVSLKPDAELSFDIEKPKTIDYEFFKNLLVVSDVEDDASKEDDKDTTIELNLEKTDWDETKWDREGTFHVVFTITDSDGNSIDYPVQFTLYSSKIKTIELTKEDFTFEVEEVIYTGEELTPNVTVKDSNNHVLTLDTDYEIVKYENNINAGTAEVIIKGKGLYSKEVTIPFTIKKVPAPKETLNSTISVSANTSSLNDIPLPTGWIWEDVSVELKEGENKVKVVFVGDLNHEKYVTEVLVVREKARILEPTKPDSESSDKKTTPNSNGNSNSQSTSTKPNKEDTNKEDTSSNPTEEEPITSNEEELPKEEEEISNSNTNSNKEETVNKEEKETSSEKKSYRWLIIPAIGVLGVALLAFLFKKILQGKDK